MSQRRRLVAVIGWLLALCAALAINIPIAIAVAAVFTLYHSVRGMVAEIQLVAFRPKTLDADPEKVRQLEEEMGFALPTLDDADIKTLVQQVEDATGLSQDKAIAYVANDLERPTNAIQAIVNPIKAALPRSDDRSWSPPSRNRFDKLAVPPTNHHIVLIDNANQQRAKVPIPPPWSWEFVDVGTASYAGTNSSRRFRCLDAVRFAFTENIIGIGWIIKIGDYESGLVNLTAGRRSFVKGDMLMIQDITTNEDTYMRLLAAYKEDHAYIPPDNDTALLRQIVSHTMSPAMIMPPQDIYIYPIGKEVKW